MLEALAREDVQHWVNFAMGDVGHIELHYHAGRILIRGQSDFLPHKFDDYRYTPDGPGIRKG